MPGDLIAAATGHPPPASGRFGTGLLSFILLSSPAIWFLQTVANYGLVSDVCSVGRLPAPGNGWLWPLVLAINLAAIVVAAAGIATALSTWRRARHDEPGPTYGMVEVGEGRTKFLSVWGVTGGVAFALGICFSTVALLLVPVCSG